MLLRVAEMLKAGSFQNQIYVIDSTQKGLSSLMEDAQDYTRSDDLAGVDSIFTKLIKELIERQKAQSVTKGRQNDSFDNDQWILSYPQICLLIDDLGETIELVDQDDNVYKRLNALVKNAVGLGLILIAAACAQDVKEMYTTNPIVSKLVGGQNGLAVSGSASLHSYYQQKNLGFEEKTTELKNRFGLLYDNGEAHKVKLMEA